MTLSLLPHSVTEPSLQISRQQSSSGEYGKGVEVILVKEDNSLPLFVALVWETVYMYNTVCSLVFINDCVMLMMFYLLIWC